MNVAALNTVPRDEWDMNSVQAVMVPRDRILWAAPEEPLQRLLERLMSADVNQMPVVQHGDDGSANIVGMVTRDAILRESRLAANWVPPWSSASKPRSVGHNIHTHRYSQAGRVAMSRNTPGRKSTEIRENPTLDSRAKQEPGATGVYVLPI